LPSLEDHFDLGHEGGDFSTNISIIFRNFREVDELLVD